MKAVKVEYVVQEEYAAQNKENIQRVMNRLKSNPIEGMLYSTYVLEDGVSFVHINIARDEETMAKLQEVEEFNNFRAALKASQPVQPPKQTKLELVGAGFEL
jgi:hypothetical protein